MRGRTIALAAVVLAGTVAALWVPGEANGQTENQPPEAAFTYEPDPSLVGEPVNFTDESQDPDGEITSWHWRFGDDDESHEQHPNHTYQEAGNHTACLTVEDDLGATDTVCKEIPVTMVVGWAQAVEAQASSSPESSVRVTVADQRGDGTSAVPNRTVAGQEVYVARSSVSEDRDGVEARAVIGEAVVTLPTGEELRLVGLETRARVTCDEVRTSTSIGRAQIGDEVVAEALEPGPNTRITLLGAELRLNSTERLGPTGIEVVGAQLQLWGLDQAYDVDLARVVGVLGFPLCSDDGDDGGGDDPVPDLIMSGRAIGVPGTADTGWITTEGPVDVNATAPSRIDTDHRLRSRLTAEAGQVISRAHVGEHMVPLGPGQPELVIRDATATAHVACDTVVLADTVLGQIWLAEDLLYEGDSPPANTVVPLPGLGELVLNRQTVDTTGNLTVTAAEIHVTSAFGEQVVPVGLANAAVDGC